MSAAKTNENKVPILTYHSIDNSGSVVSTSRETFAQQMRALTEAGYSTITLSRLVHCMQQEQSLPAKTVVVTFDDGYRNVYSEAFPILEGCGFTATVFLITDYCGKTNDWPGNWGGPTNQSLLSWPEINELHKRGFEIGSHTVTHPNLTSLPIAQAELEIKQSQSAIQDRLGSSVIGFAYPYGSYNPQIRTIVKKYFQSACTTKLGKVGLRNDPFLLKRIDAYYLSSQRTFGRLLGQSLDRYLQLRQVVRDVKALGLRVF